MDFVGPALGLLGSLVAILAAFSQRRMSHRLDTELKAGEAALKQHVDIQLQHVRGDVERDLKNHEVRLRVAADFRLKMLDRMLTDVAEFRSKLGAAIGATILLMDEVVPRGGRTEQASELLTAAQRSFAALSGAGPFMPAELHESAIDIANEFKACLSDAVDWANLESKDERHARCVITTAKMSEIGGRSRKLFTTWQGEQFRSFATTIDRIDANNEPRKAGLLKQ